MQTVLATLEAKSSQFPDEAQRALARRVLLQEYEYLQQQKHMLEDRFARFAARPVPAVTKFAVLSVVVQYRRRT